MSDETLIADLVRAGLTDPELLQRVANLLVQVSHNVPGDYRDKRREFWREKKRRQRAKSQPTQGNSEANDAELPAGNVSELSPDVPDNRADLTSFLSSESLPANTESKQEVARARRGSRLTAGLAISQTDYESALELGLPDREIQSAWVEFVDYWIAVPGHRGVKSNWPATWRNRVRELVKRRAGRNDGQKRSLLATIDHVTDYIGDGSNYVPGSSGPRALSLDLGPSPPGVRFLPKG